MKACPRCDLVYNYELLQFCRFDGTRLVKTYSGEETTQRCLCRGYRIKPPEFILTTAQVNYRTERGRTASTHLRVAISKLTRRYGAPFCAIF